MRTQGRNTRRFLTVALLLAASRAIGLYAHTGPDEHLVTMFVSPSASELTVLARVPAQLLGDAGARLESGADVERALAVIASDVTTNLEFQQAGVLLPAPRVRTVVSSADDRSFDTFASARAHFSNAQPVATASAALVDIELTYPVRADVRQFSARLNTFRAPGKPVRTVVQFLPEGGSTRSFNLTGDPMRTLFDPASGGAVREFAARGMHTLQAAGDWLLFAICLALPRRNGTLVRRVMIAFFATEAISLLAGAAGIIPLSVRGSLELALASVVVVAALQAAIGSSEQSIWRLAIVAGALLGSIAGQDFHAGRAFAGDHLVLGFVTFAVIIGAAQLWAIGLVRAAAGLAYRAGLPERLTTIAMAVVVCHFATHWMIERSGGDGYAAAVATAVWAAILVAAALAGGSAFHGTGHSAVELHRPSESRTT